MKNETNPENAIDFKELEKLKELLHLDVDVRTTPTTCILKKANKEIELLIIELEENIEEKEELIEEFERMNKITQKNLKNLR